ncbi:50S ribosomal protein L29 [Flavobacteriaceae bacterium]|jgi:large subunit ribosomal protein L29|nr:50S ribosomal protein L29 [Flavobacteriaceae bacterium]MDA9886747.1 50S ribosomal protein L29 [Flavobacteriaceae bacterium]MDA9972300.1 50S ribosomal protein L29 [Flavobacteriaceae bacterium]MDB4187062.1 50S ribosomal protein L29 [Flavobacteriaceae bacterium]MDB9886045.1 50S ribosomal protein L29 [Flavobacteriaceae bacterium]
MKQSEINNLSIADLQDKLTEHTKQLNELNLAHAITPLENPLQIRSARKTVARLHTAITQRQQEA